jgi:hypothetical protein
MHYLLYKAWTDRGLVHSAKGRICTCYTCNTSLDKRPGIFIGDKPTLCSERILHKDSERNGSVEKTLVVSLKGLGAKTSCQSTDNKKMYSSSFRNVFYVSF